MGHGLEEEVEDQPLGVYEREGEAGGDPSLQVVDVTDLGEVTVLVGLDGNIVTDLKYSSLSVCKKV